MSSNLEIIAEVVAGRYHAPELGGPLPSPIRRVALERSLAGQERELIDGTGLGKRLAVVTDETTFEVLGRRVHQALASADLVVLDHPKADEVTAAELQARVEGADGLVAVGSGTINDLCKYVTYRTGRNCAVFATAPSMDGYVTTTVSISKDQFKASLPAHAPRGVFFDLEILCKAPKRMILSGFGDTICRSTAQVDWLLSHLLLDTVYAETPYRLMAADEPLLLRAASGIGKGDPEALLRLTRLLILSGLGVLVTNTSHCGSMGEHGISHYIDMLAKPHPGTLHGQQVGVGTWTMGRLQAGMLESETPPRLSPIEPDADFDLRFGRFASAFREAMARKPFDELGTARVNRRLEDSWPEIRRRLLAVMLPVVEMERAIRAAGMPHRGRELGLDPAFYRQAVAHAHEIRDRYCFLDLAAQAGMLGAFAAGEE
jgi:glycerol-1-phosphate dehydrogenase [NAD(P)+]